MQRLFSEDRIGGAGERVVIVLLIGDIGGGEAELMDLLPRGLIGVAADHGQDGAAKIRRNRRGINQVLLEAVTTSGHDAGIIELAESTDETGAQVRQPDRLVGFWFPAKGIEAGTQNGARVALEFFTLRLAEKEPIGKFKGVDDLLAFGQFGDVGQRLDQPQVAGQGDAVGLHERPFVAQEIHAVGTAQLRQGREQEIPRLVIILHPVVARAVHVQL